MSRCVVFGCVNEVVREAVHRDDPSVKICLCALHVRRAVRYMTDAQVGRWIFPWLEAEASRRATAGETTR